ncbi:glycosyltransferase family 90 protein [Hortaea werneckii]|nr:glycosyltransferase family 90 protein [Hortaea werneckii]KAI7106421.1 glycosyltransferase family 90 protein [Hortaea werneckii]KAI7236674.1 glycosyltransferase family 90 protein [Hortaea werneckii]KAI7319316.1 glycosyltransferase family 90 protein [Hortaea werneckii]KAI7399099.1 glycosyltransferase family 90 protein [Hortaea werneckii]
MSLLLSSRFQHGSISSSFPLLLTATLLVTSIAASLFTSTRHSLLTSTCAWLAISVFTTSRIGLRSLLDAAPNQKLAWSAGYLFSLASVEERSVGNNARTIWWAKALLPLAVWGVSSTIASTDFLPTTNTTGHSETGGFSSGRESPTGSDKPGNAASTGSLGRNRAKTPLVILSASAVAAVYTSSGTNTVLSLGLSYTLLAALALLLVERARVEIAHSAQRGSNDPLIYSANGFLAQSDESKPPLSSGDAAMTIIRDVATSAAACTGIASLMSETWRFGGLAYSGVLGDAMGEQWIWGQAVVRLVIGIGMVGVHAVMYGGLLMMLQRPLRMPTLDLNGSKGAAAVPLDPNTVGTPSEEYAPLNYTETISHPIDQLVRNAEASWLNTLQSQSQSLESAVTQYTKRYNLPPPPNFDKWYEYATERDVQLIDEYDTIYHSLLPFWALSPATIRSRVREACGFQDNNLMCLLIRDGKSVHVEGGQPWLQEAIVGMIGNFVQHLPDMDLAFNVHDEPRVVVPHDELERLIRTAITENLPAALANPTPRNAFSSRPADLGKGKRIPEVKTTRFNVFAHQPTWIPSRLSCPATSPARCLATDTCPDNFTAYSLGDLGFVYNHTAFSDVCNSPSFASSHGFFDRPNAFNVIHDLFPVFSQSKMSSFQDILYPSPWYWYGKVAYEEKKDPSWAEKVNSLWWRGSTTGGFSRNGGWRRQHRQKLVQKLNALDTAKILTNANADKPDVAPHWQTKEVARKDFNQVMDVHFSHVGQCDPGDCDAQKEFFTLAPPVDQQEAWRFRYLLDLDGNAFSGRFYAFLRSRSLVFKMAVFREWHEEWIKPWVHYIPLSLRGDEALESVRYLSAEGEGKKQGVRMAEASREWAGKVLRNEDFETWFFRLLLEYGRLVDDNRLHIGYAGS